MAGIDPDLLESPYVEPPSRQGRHGARIVAIAVMVCVAAAATIWFLTRSDADGDEADGVGPSTATTEAGADLRLVAYTPDTPLLTHPTLLPEGWDACSVSEDRFEPDRFCSTDQDRWVEVAYAIAGSSDTETAVPAGSHDGEWVSESDPFELRFPINEHVAGVVRSHGLDADMTLEIADSIPIIADRASLYATYDLPIDWGTLTGDDLVDLLGQFESDAAVDLGRWELTVRTSNASLYGFNTRSNWTSVAATDLPMARLIPADRPLVVGASPDLHKGYAVWDQAGMAWRLEGNLDADEAAALALSVIATFDDLPRDLSR